MKWPFKYGLLPGLLTILIPFLNLGLVYDELLLSLELPAARPEGLWLLAARYLIPAEPIKLLTLTTLTYDVEWFLSDIICD